MNLYFSSWTYTISPEAASDGEETSDAVVCGEGHDCTLPKEEPLASMTSSWLSSVRLILRLFKKFLYMDPVYDEILASVRGRIWKQHTWFRKPLEDGLKLAVTPRHLVVGTMYSDMQYGWRVSENTLSDVFMEMCQAICDEYANEVMTKMDRDNSLMDFTGVEISPTVLLLLMASMWQSESLLWLLI